jgi:hypothetical protein
LAEETWILKKYGLRLWAWLNWSRTELDGELFVHCNKHYVAVILGIVWPFGKPSTLLRIALHHDFSFAFRNSYLYLILLLIWFNTDGTGQQHIENWTQICEFVNIENISSIIYSFRFCRWILSGLCHSNKTESSAPFWNTRM